MVFSIIFLLINKFLTSLQNDSRARKVFPIYGRQRTGGACAVERRRGGGVAVGACGELAAA